MKKHWVILLILALLLPNAAAQADEARLSVVGEMQVYSISSENQLYGLNSTTGSLADLGSDEYLAFTMKVTNGGPDVYCDTLYARIDGGEPLHWASSTIVQDTTANCHIFYSNMSNVRPGRHTVDMFANDVYIGSAYFTILRDWSECMNIPSASEISYGETQGRSPYIGFYPDMSVVNNRFTEYSVDFCADCLPNGTYVCIGTFDMDKSDLESRYSSVYADYPNNAGYAGFQVLPDGTHCAILSLWDTYCSDGSSTTTLHATRLYPATNLAGDTFGGEGTGVHCIVPYAWESGHWYRALLQCGVSASTGNTTVKLSVCDLETGVWTKLIEYETCFRNSCFKGKMVSFLECFDTTTAADLRTLEEANMRARDAGSGQWIDVEQLSFYQNYDYSGSYAYGSDGACFWAITTGLTQRAPIPESGLTVRVSNTEHGWPY